MPAKARRRVSVAGKTADTQYYLLHQLLKLGSHRLKFSSKFYENTYFAQNWPINFDIEKKHESLILCCTKGRQQGWIRYIVPAVSRDLPLSDHVFLFPEDPIGSEKQPCKVRSHVLVCSRSWACICAWPASTAPYSDPNIRGDSIFHSILSRVEVTRIFLP